MLYALTVAGSDPTGGAGLQADLAVWQSLGIHGLSVASSLTAQNTLGVQGTLGIDPEFVERQLECLLEDIKPGALKTGMLYGGGAVRAVCSAIDRYSLVNLVVDPVCVSSSGHSLLDDEGVDLMRLELFRRARVVTPNVPEAVLLTARDVRTPDDMAQAAKDILAMGPEVVVLKGGHMEGEPVDVYCDRDGIRLIEARRMEGEYHGTGCVFSAAMTGYLCMGRTPYESAVGAKEYIARAMAQAHRPGGGAAILGFI